MDFDLRNKRILVVGDMMLDRYVYGSVNRVASDAPIPVMNQGSVVDCLGGAANVGHNIKTFGCTSVDVVGLIGDGDAWPLLDQMGKAGIGGFFHRDASRPTTVKTRYMAGDQQVFRVDHEATHAMSAEIEADMLESIHSIAPYADAIVISDYAKGAVSPAVVEAVMQYDAPVIVDPKRRALSAYSYRRNPTVVTPNSAELLASMPEANGDEDAAAEMAMCDGSLDALLVTQGERGMTLYQQHQPTIRIMAARKDNTAPCGAGDTVVAVLAAGLASGVDLYRAAYIANIAAGIAVTKPRTATVMKGELQAAL